MATYYVEQVDLGPLRRELGNLEQRVGEVESAQSSLEPRVGTLEEDQSAAEERLDVVEAKLADEFDALVQAVEKVQDQTAKLRQHLEWVSHHVVETNEVGEAHLEDPDDLVDALLNRVRDGAAAQDRLGPVLSEQLQYQHTLHQHKTTTEQFQAKTAVAVEATKRILATTPHTDSRTRVVNDYEGGRSAVEQATSLLNDMASDVQAAREGLADSERRQAREQPLIDAGTTATGQLHARLRARVAAAVSDYHLLPRWLITELGHTPPPGDHSEEWMNLATDVLTFRIIHGVTDPVVALGPARGVTGEGSLAREQLGRRLRTFRAD